MQIISTAWIPRTLEDFELDTCLGVHAEHGRASAEAPFTVIVMEGFEKVTPDYAARMAAGHVRLVDGAAAAREALARCRPLGAVANAYDMLCFARWFVVEAVLAGEPFLHIDLDLFFQPRFTEVRRLFAGRTLTFGSPCLAAVSDHGWLRAYREAIEALARDPAGFQAAIGYGGSAFRRHIGSDQDLLQGLTRAGRLPRGDAGPLPEDFAIFINPLFPETAQRRQGAPMVASREDGIDRLDGRPVLFWHFQNSFADYAGRFLALEHQRRRGGGGARFQAPIRLDLPIFALRPTAENFAFAMLQDLAERQKRRGIAEGRTTMETALGMTAQEPLDYFHRTVATRHFVLRGEGRGLFSEEHWWKPGVFAPGATPAAAGPEA